MQINVLVPLEAFEPSYLSSYVDMRLDIVGQMSQDERLLTRAKMEISAIGINDVKSANNTVNETVMPLVQKFFKTNNQTLPYYITLRSSVVEISTRGRFSNADFFNRPITVGFNFNRIW